MRYVVPGLVAGTDRSWSGQLSGLQAPQTLLLLRSLDTEDSKTSDRAGYPPPASVVVVKGDPLAGRG